MNEKKKMLTIKEAANVIDGLTEYRIRQLCLTGAIPCFKAGKKFLINQDTLINYVCGNSGA